MSSNKISVSSSVWGHHLCSMPGYCLAENLLGINMVHVKQQLGHWRRGLGGSCSVHKTTDAPPADL